MKKKQLVLLLICAVLLVYFYVKFINGFDKPVSAESSINKEALFKGKRLNDSCWVLDSIRGISLKINDDNVLPYSDNIEMAGERVAAIVSYEITKDGTVSIEREVFFPQLHEYKSETDGWFHDYRAYLKGIYTDELLPKLYIDQTQFVPGKLESVHVNGMLRFDYLPSGSGLRLSRSFVPSTKERLFAEVWSLTNTTKTKLVITSGNTALQFEDYGVKGKFTRKVISNAPEAIELGAGDEFLFSLKVMAKLNNENYSSENERELLCRRGDFLNEMSAALQLETPNDGFNKLFEFSKIRASESIFQSELGLIHSPGGGRYYVGIWANDQAEYVSPFFPYLGYETGNISAMNCYRAFAGELNSAYNPIRYAFEVEGLVEPFIKDRGDAAMIAYGAAHYAMALGNESVARELWPLIEWCLEYCNRQVNSEGVVNSESDEMEGRIETGTANLSTSSLYYGALCFASDLGLSLNKPMVQINNYKKEAVRLKQAIEKYFGAHIEGLNTYKYYKEHQFLRHWICLPLVMGIHERKEETTRALFDKLWTGNGVHVEKNSDNPEISKIFWDRATLYALRGTLIAGETEKSIEKLHQFTQKRLLGSRVPYVVEAFPEGDMAHLSAESALYCRVFIEGLFGIKPKGLNRFQLCPRLPKKWDRMALRHIKAFNHNFDVLVSAVGEHIKVEIYESEKCLLVKTIKAGEVVDFVFS